MDIVLTERAFISNWYDNKRATLCPIRALVIMIATIKWSLMVDLPGACENITDTIDYLIEVFKFVLLKLA